MKKPLILIIMDGWGINPEKENNAVYIAKTPNIDTYKEQYPYCELGASGSSVGLPDGQMGNSEVGHLNLGAGRIVHQDFSLIDAAIKKKAFFDNDELNALCKKLQASNASLHVMGLLSDGGVHSHIRHLFALLDIARKYKLKNVFIHAFLDGRDTPPEGGQFYLQETLDYIKDDEDFRLVTMSGRFYAMDRDNRWERVKKAYDALITGEGRKSAGFVATIKERYKEKETDEFIVPTVLQGDYDYKGMRPGDGIVFFNFRADRAREITRAFTQKDFDGFDASNNVIDGDDFVCFTEYDENFHLKEAFKPTPLINILGDEVSKSGLNQLRISETEKYAHVTFFFNGGDEHPFGNEDRALIPSPKEVPTYDKKPEMSAYLVAAEAIKRIQSGKYDLIVLNFANADMVGHTGVLEAAVKACETVDECVGKVVAEILARGGEALITADHGNAEKMYDEENDLPHTAHTTNPVPFIVVSDRVTKLRDGGILADVAPTIMQLLGLKQPKEMTGRSIMLHLI
jgi:2,3-bisphosphoglycerate-independent phosphoglycerate mutase